MDSPSRDTNHNRNPESIREAIETISKLDTETFTALFSDFAEFTRSTARQHRTCSHPAPLVLAGINLTDDNPGIDTVSDPSVIDAPPTEPHLDKPEHLEQYDVIAILQANDFLDDPEHIQGALIEALSSQWHIVSMLTDVFGEHATDALIDEATNTEEFGELMENLYGTATADGPTQEEPAVGLPTPHPMEFYPADSLTHLVEYENGVECKHCSAFYYYDEMQEALRCCPTDDREIPDEPI